MLLLFLISVEPYLYNLITVSFVPLPGQLDSGITTALYAVDMGAILLIIAYFTHEAAIEERRLIPRELLRNYRLQRNTAIASAALFFFSTLQSDSRRIDILQLLRSATPSCARAHGY